MRPENSAQFMPNWDSIGMPMAHRRRSNAQDTAPEPRCHVTYLRRAEVVRENNQEGQSHSQLRETGNDVKLLDDMHAVERKAPLNTSRAV